MATDIICTWTFIYHKKIIVIMVYIHLYCIIRHIVIVIRNFVTASNATTPVMPPRAWTTHHAWFEYLADLRFT